MATFIPALLLAAATTFAGSTPPSTADLEEYAIELRRHCISLGAEARDCLSRLNAFMYRGKTSQKNYDWLARHFEANEGRPAVPEIHTVGPEPPWPGFEIKGLRIGQSEEDVLIQLGPWASCSTASGLTVAERVCRVRDSFGGVGARLAAFLLDGRVSSIAISLPESQSSLIAAGLRKKWGEPEHDEVRETQNRMGATFDFRQMRWSRGEEVLEFSQRASKVDESLLWLSSLADLPRRLELLDQEAERAAEDM